MKRATGSLLTLSIIFYFLSCRTNDINAYQYSIQKSIECAQGAVVSAHPLASKVGTEVLKDGGNAFDAAIATQLALAVVYPGAGNIGGGGFLLAHTEEGKNIAIDYREKAPGLAYRDMYLDDNGNAVLAKSQNGHLASGVPGTVSGIFAAYKYARLPFEKLIGPAITLAERGFVITESEAKSLNGNKKDFTSYNSTVPVFVKDHPWKSGDTLIQKDLAGTLKRIRDNGEKGFYEGKTAELIAEEMKKGGGIITLEDLKNYRAKEREPVVFRYKNDYTIIGMPMPSSGGVLLEQMLKMIEKSNIAQYGFQSVKAVHLMAEAERRAFADRAEFMGDADYYRVPVKELVNEKYITGRMNDFDPARASLSANIRAGSFPSKSEETTHLSVADKWGNCVAVTTTLNGSYGSSTVVTGAGFLLNNEMDDFSVKPGVPNMYGAVGGEANAIAPGKRMLSSMTPTIVLKNNHPFLVTGTPGGTTIPTSVFQTLVNIIEFGLSPADAVNKPKFHHQWLPDTLYIEKDFPGAVADSLSLMGYALLQRGAIGRTELILFGSRKLVAVADKRGDDDAEGY